MAGRAWRVRLAALATAAGFLAVALGIRIVASSDGVLDSSGALQQYSGTALYASMVYAGVFVLTPRTTPMVAGAEAIAFCWLVEFLQLTGLPAELSEQNLVARLVLGVRFDAIDLAWYLVGVLPLVVFHLLISHRVLRARCVPDEAGSIDQRDSQADSAKQSACRPTKSFAPQACPEPVPSAVTNGHERAVKPQGTQRIWDVSTLSPSSSTSTRPTRNPSAGATSRSTKE
jgi:hypothetical protein